MEKINFKAGHSSGEIISRIHASKTQAHFDTVRMNASDRGMKLNNNKMKMIAISAARSYTPSPYISMPEGGEMDSSPSLRVLGFISARIRLLGPT